MKQIDIYTQSAGCGCVYKYEEGRWVIKTYCSQHEPKWSKKADRVYHRIHKKTGRGYTKSPKPLKDR